jgi:hypothetical protein
MVSLPSSLHLTLHLHFSRSLCGLPFKKLDKKSEKNFLFARRQQLLLMLEGSKSSDASSIFYLTMILLFQQVKNLVVPSGASSRFRHDLLRLLASERKISDGVAESLRSLACSLEMGVAVDTALVDTVKAIGMCRDISKHHADGTT